MDAKERLLYYTYCNTTESGKYANAIMKITPGKSNNSDLEIKLLLFNFDLQLLLTSCVRTIGCVSSLKRYTLPLLLLTPKNRIGLLLLLGHRSGFN